MHNTTGHQGLGPTALTIGRVGIKPLYTIDLDATTLDMSTKPKDTGLTIYHTSSDYNL